MIFTILTIILGVVLLVMGVGLILVISPKNVIRSGTDGNHARILYGLWLLVVIGYIAMAVTP